MVFFDAGAFRPIDDFKTEVTEFAEYLRSTPTMDGVEQVYCPGEIEHLRTSGNRREDIEIAPSTWESPAPLARELNEDLPESGPPRRR